MSRLATTPGNLLVIPSSSTADVGVLMTASSARVALLRNVKLI